MNSESFVVRLPVRPGVSPQQMKLFLTDLLYRAGFADEEISVRRMRPGTVHMVDPVSQPGTDIIVHSEIIPA